MELTARHIKNNEELLKAMDTVVGFLNDEDGFEPWLMCGLPDGWDEDDLAFMAADEDLMDAACKAFRHSMAHSKAGWYTRPFAGSGVGMAYGDEGE